MEDRDKYLSRKYSVKCDFEYFEGDFPKMEFEVGEMARYWGIHYLSKNGEICTIVGKNGTYSYEISFEDGKTQGCGSYRLEKIPQKGRVKKKNPELDPYDEEDWGWEKIEEKLDRNLYLKKARYEDIDVLMGNFPDEFFSPGERVIYWGGSFPKKNGEICTIVGDGMGRFNYKLVFDDGFVHSGCDCNRLEKLNKNVRKIKHLDIDPYDEEDWGFEEIKKNISDEIEEGKIVNEKYGYPDAITPTRDFLINFVSKRFDWWLNRKAPANYSENFVFDMDDVNPKIRKNKNFPLKTLRFKLTIIPEKNMNAVSGVASNYKKQRQSDPDYWYSKVYRGEIIGDIEIHIHPGRRTIEIQDIKEEIQATITHELEHLYTGYKRHFRGINPDIHHKRNFLSNCLYEPVIKYRKCKTYHYLTLVYYYLASEHETQALMSEYYTTREKDVNYKNIILFMNMNFDELYGKIKKEFKKYYPKANLDNIPIKIYNDVINGWKQSRLKYEDWIEEYYTDFESFIKLMHDKIKFKGPRFIKKANKAIYGEIESINEKYGYPDSLTPTRDFLIKFINKKFDWWLGRENQANYSEEFTIDMDDVDPKIRKNKDFPLQLLRLKLTIIPSEINYISGYSSTYKRKRESDPDYFLSRIYRGDIQAKIDILIYPGENVIETQVLKEKIKMTITHELQHLYGNYKRAMKNYDFKKQYFNNITSRCLINLMNKYPDCNYFNALVTLYYAFSKIEFPAYMSEFTIRDIKKSDISPYSEFAYVYNTEFEDLYRQISKEFDAYYGDVNKDYIPIQDMYVPITLSLDYYKMKDSRVIKFNVNFKKFIAMMYNDVIRKGPKFIKKMNKAYHGQ